MSTQVQCPNPECRMTASVSEDKLGRSGRCKRCGTRFTLTPSSHDVPPPAVGPPAAGAGSAVPAVIGRYQVRAKLGSGAFGTVYRSYDPQLDREVALKVLHPDALTSPQAVERFQREARAAAKMHHSHIVPVHDAGQHGGHYFITSALIPGRTLASAIPDSGMDPRRAAQMALQLAEALTYAHQQGVLHRDVKPGNIMLDDQDTLYLMDFGLAGWTEPASARLTKVGGVLGTPAYMAPEQARGDLEQVGPQSDLYSAGMVLYEMLTGRVPFEGPVPAVVYNVIHTPPPPPSQFRPGLDPRLEAICLKALAKRPEERFAGGGDMAVALQAWLQGQEPLPRQPRAIPLPRPQAAIPTTREAWPTVGTQGNAAATSIAKTVAEPVAASAAGSGRSGRGWLLPAGAVVLLGIGLAVLLFFLFPGKRPGTPDADRAEVRTPAEALTLLKTEDNAARNLAIVFLIRIEPVGAEQAEIARQLALLQAKGGVPRVENALIRWATTEQVPVLLTLWKQEGAPRNELRQAFVKLKDRRGADAVAGQLKEVGERDQALAALREMGPEVAAPALAAHENDPDAGVSVVVRKQLKEWSVKGEPKPSVWDTSKAGAVSSNSLGIKFAFVPRGRFWMGGESGHPGTKEATIPHDFFLGVYKVTQEQWQALMEANPSYYSRTGPSKDKVKDISDEDLAQFPVENVSSEMVQEFLDKLNDKEKVSGWVYRLPTEAEWEYACRGAPSSKQECSFCFYFQKPTNNLSADEANFNGEQPFGNAKKGTFLGRPTRVGSYKPNRLGLYDMHGNVGDLCDDLHEAGGSRYVRGGCFCMDGVMCQTSSRGLTGHPLDRRFTVGFRLARVPVR
jgi:formylglycine-generating enzyme required for sulfatase activity